MQNPCPNALLSLLWLILRSLIEDCESRSLYIEIVNRWKQLTFRDVVIFDWLAELRNTPPPQDTYPILFGLASVNIYVFDLLCFDLITF